MQIVDANTNITLAKITLKDGESATISTTTASEEVVIQVDLVRSDKSIDTYYLKQTNKGNIYMNKNLREKHGNKT